VGGSERWVAKYGAGRMAQDRDGWLKRWVLGIYVQRPKYSDVLIHNDNQRSRDVSKALSNTLLLAKNYNIQSRIVLILLLFRDKKN
jgi:hypothetical protein